MNRFAVHIGIAVMLFVALAAFDLFSDNDPFLIAEFANDAFEWALISVGVAAASYVVLGLRDAQLERKGLVKDLSQARADGDKWRPGGAGLHARPRRGDPQAVR